MKRLVLLRHAKSSWDDASLDDHERPLAKRGRIDARRMGRYLAQHGLVIDTVLCSTARRTRETWDIVARELACEPRVRFMRALYLPTQQALRRALEEAGASETVLVVGHSPSLDAFLLTHVELGTERARIVERVPTGSLAVVELPPRWLPQHAKRRGKLVSFATPRELEGQAVEPAPVHGERVEISPRTRVHQLAQLAVASSIDHVRRNTAGAARGVDPEYAHQLRVGLRRLRVALRLFRAQVGHERVARLLVELRWIFGLAGAVRELDVFGARVVGPLAAREPPRRTAGLRRKLRAERASAQASFVAALGSARWERLVRELVALETDIAAEATSTPRLTTWAPKRLDRRLRRVRALSESVTSLDMESLHALRKQLKKLRYTADLVRGAFPARHAKRFVRSLAAVQDVLGSIHDAAVAERIAARMVRGLPSATREQTRRMLAAEIDRQLTAELAALPPAFERFARVERFWR